MFADDVLTAVFDKGSRNGVDSLTPSERELYRIQEFILDFEMGGLSGYIYNHLSEPATISATITAMRSRKLIELASLLTEVASLFKGYVESESRPTWGSILKFYDPRDHMKVIEKRIHALPNYGLDQGVIG